MNKKILVLKNWKYAQSFLWDNMLKPKEPVNWIMWVALVCQQNTANLLLQDLFFNAMWTKYCKMAADSDITSFILNKLKFPPPGIYFKVINLLWNILGAFHSPSSHRN